jgi:hypothetical protein
LLARSFTCPSFEPKSLLTTRDAARGFRSFSTARRTIQGFEAMLWLRKGFGFAGAWTVREQNRLLAVCFGLPAANKVCKQGRNSPSCSSRQSLRQAQLQRLCKRKVSHDFI